MPINRELLERKINLILEDLENIRQLSPLPLETYLADARNEALAERYLERIIGRAIDINYHIATEALRLTPKDYAESFLFMEKAGVLSGSDARAFARLAGLRNRISHEYNGIDAQLIHQALGRVAQEMPSFLRAVRDFLLRMDCL